MRTFILDNTHLQRPPLVPELQLHLADDVMSIWRTTQARSKDIDAPPPFWAFAWAGGQGVARYLLDHPGEVACKRVLDFAAGSGMCAIAALMSGASHAWAADTDSYSGHAVELNARVNRVGVTFSGHDLLNADPPTSDLILAGDVCYDKFMSQRVLTWLGKAHAHGARVLIGDPARNYFPHESMVCLAEYEVQTTLDLEGTETKRTGVYTFACGVEEPHFSWLAHSMR